MFEKFKKFLEDNGALEEFTEMLMNDEGMSVEDWVDNEDINPEDLISCAFMWEVTERGDAFWSELCNKWALGC